MLRLEICLLDAIYLFFNRPGGSYHFSESPLHHKPRVRTPGVPLQTQPEVEIVHSSYIPRVSLPNSDPFFPWEITALVCMIYLHSHLPRVFMVSEEHFNPCGRGEGLCVAPQANMICSSPFFARDRHSFTPHTGLLGEKSNEVFKIVQHAVCNSYFVLDLVAIKWSPEGMLRS